MILPPGQNQQSSPVVSTKRKKSELFPDWEWVRIFVSIEEIIDNKNPGKLSIAAIPHFLTETFPENLELSSLNSTFFQEQEHKKRLDCIEY